MQCYCAVAYTIINCIVENAHGDVLYDDATKSHKCICCKQQRNTCIVDYLSRGYINLVFLVFKYLGHIPNIPHSTGMTVIQ